MAAGWTFIKVTCRPDGFRLQGRRRLDARVATLDIAVYDVVDGREVWVDLAAQVEGGTGIGSPPDPPATCE